MEQMVSLAGSIFGGALLSAMFLGIALVPALLYRQPPENEARLAIVRPMENTEFTKATFTPAQMETVIPDIKLVACIFSEKAIRYHVRPALVTLPSCAWKHDLVSIAPNLIDITVSGTATIDKVDRPFTVVLQHNPGSDTEDGLIITGIQGFP